MLMQEEREHIVALSARDAERLREWLEAPNGSFVGARLVVEATERGGVLVRTRPYTAAEKAQAARVAGVPRE